MTALPKQVYSVEEYVEFDREAEGRYEYFDGGIFDMAGGSPDHARIGGNIYARLQERLRGRECEAFNSEMRIKVPAAPPYRYPDASVVCGKAVFEDVLGQIMLVNPVLIVEVLSKSTKGYDLTEKFLAYQSIDSFKEYLVVSQTQPQVIQHLKQADGRWLRHDITDSNGSVTLETINATLSLHEIYERVKFPPPSHFKIVEPS